MSDLISRSAVLKIIDEAIMNTSDFLQHDTQIDIQFKVEELPIAYDVDKVVEELEEMQGIQFDGMKESYQLDWCIETKRAIEIVKGGVVR